MELKLAKLGWNETFQRQLSHGDLSNAMPARIIREDRGRYTVHTGDQTLNAQVSGAFRNQVQSPLDLPTVGDWVILERPAQGEMGTLHRLLERKSLFTRQTAGDRTDVQLLAANIDSLCIVAGLDQELNVKRIQRYLAQAWKSGAEPVILLNKCDLIQDRESMLAILRAELPEVAMHVVSALTLERIECLHPLLAKGKTLAFCGSSGVGKSSLINALLGENRLKTQDNRVQDHRGRHTTTWRELIVLDNGACVIDLPGMRELQLTGDPASVQEAFADVRGIATQCRYRNCRHQGEPGCAIAAAILRGELSDLRLQQFLKLDTENRSVAFRSKKTPSTHKPKPRKWEEKESYFKDITVQHRKQQKAQQKWEQGDGS